MANGAPANPAGHGPRRVFTITPDKQGLTYTVKIETTSESVSGNAAIQLSKGEFGVLQNLFASAIPKLIMWEHGFEPIVDASGGGGGGAAETAEPMAFGWNKEQ